MKIDKNPLNLNEYEQYEIDQRYSAYVIQINDISENDSEHLEWEYTTQGYKIFHSELNRSRADRFNFRLIIAKLDHTF